jgi:predicted transposase/invertase (TIGR01784 family)
MNVNKKHKDSMFSSPEFIVLYNGKDPYPDYGELKLSDAFMDIEGLKSEKDRKIPLELIVQVYNINYGHNREILERSPTLDGYSIFIDKVRELQKNADLPLEEAVKNAIKYCTENNKLRDFFKKNSSEVFNMLTEWNQEEYVEVAREEAREEGIAQGFEKGMEQAARNFLAMGITIDETARATGLPVEKVRALTPHSS